jgi:peptide/nickel transport system permease protein
VIRFCVGRVLSALFVVGGVVIGVFLLLHLVPGDPVEVMLGEYARPADREALRQSLGLDRPLAAQLSSFVRGLLSFDFGYSLHSRRPIIDVLSERLGPTAILAGSALLVSVSVAVPLGIVAAMRQDSAVDAGAITFAMIGAAIPNFVLGPLLVLVFSLWLGWLPVSGFESAASLVLPSLTLGMSLAAVLSRMVRSTLLEALGQDFIRTARAKGLSEREVVVRHALGNALLPIVTLTGLQLGALLAGTVITETVFAWPGLGQLLIEAIERRDYPLVQSAVLIIALTYVVVNTVTDVVYAALDPRIRLGE